jgi:hypothetical protein
MAKLTHLPEFVITVSIHSVVMNRTPCFLRYARDDLLASKESNLLIIKTTTKANNDEANAYSFRMNECHFGAS